jgi:Rps23 Pro-64 3,4-dihydroxylase Tpa1-like proline 4-hydroxylase
LELVAHGDGAVFKTHKDTATGVVTGRSPRQISMVYYLHSRPKRFTGGQLRYYAIGQNAFIDIEPGHDVLLAFPSIAPHSVERVACPGVPFADWRFAVNIWLHGESDTV